MDTKEAAERLNGPDHIAGVLYKAAEEDVLPGDIVQIVDTEHHWCPCLVIVSELKAFGVQGYVLIPHNDGRAPGAAYTRLERGKYEKVGTAALMTQSDHDERDAALRNAADEVGRV